MRLRTMCLVGAAAAGLASLATPASSQSVLDRSPNLSNSWVGSSGTMYFHFVHRFTASPPPERKVSNVPSFLTAIGLPKRTLLGAVYATNSQLAPRYPNEWEFFVRNAPFLQADGAPLDVIAHVGYNLASEGVDGELSLARRQGPLRMVAVGRILADPLVQGKLRFAAGGGGTLRLGRYMALAGDAVSLLNPEAEERLAWSAGLHLALPTTPHTLSLQVANTNAATLQGASRGSDQLRYGFEFTIPLHLGRFFPSDDPPAPVTPPAPTTPPASAPASAPAGEVVKASIKNLAFSPGQIEIEAGTTIEWTNDDQLAHTVTADDGQFDSGLIQPGQKWSYTFEKPGTYSFFCSPHPFMKGAVVVR